MPPQGPGGAWPAAVGGGTGMVARSGDRALPRPTAGGVVRRVLRGSAWARAEVRRRTGTGQEINTSYLERLHATFRAQRTGLVRRGRALRHEEGRLAAGRYLGGCAYNFCWGQD